jgi:acyl carrier protein
MLDKANAPHSNTWVADGHDDGNRTMSSLKELQDLIQEKYGLDPSKLDPNASMRNSGIDSLGLVEFLFAVEDHYGISLPDDVVDKLRAAQTA